LYGTERPVVQPIWMAALQNQAEQILKIQDS